jgi:hypothetical protein
MGAAETSLELEAEVAQAATTPITRTNAVTILKIEVFEDS